MPDLKKLVAALRQEYRDRELSLSSVDADPMKQFEVWFKDTLAAEQPEANAMSLATVNSSGCPSVRTVLLKGFDERGFMFYTNYLSNKSRDISQNPQVSLCFHWNIIGRQVIIKGKAEKLPASESDEYFAIRPYGSQIGAWASQQSSEVTKDELTKKAEHYTSIYKEGNVPRPDFWGGFVVTPFEIEFWQGRPNRLHDRIVYSLSDGQWNKKRVSP